MGYIIIEICFYDKKQLIEWFKDVSVGDEIYVCKNESIHVYLYKQDGSSLWTTAENVKGMYLRAIPGANSDKPRTAGSGLQSFFLVVNVGN